MGMEALGNAISRSSSDADTQGTGEELLARCVLVRKGEDGALQALVIRRTDQKVYTLPEDLVCATQDAAQAALCALSLHAGLSTPACLADYLGSHLSLLGTVHYFSAWSCCDLGAERCSLPARGTLGVRWVPEAELDTLCLEEENQRGFLLAACRPATMTTDAL